MSHLPSPLTLPAYNKGQTFHHLRRIAHSFSAEPGREFLRVFTKGNKVTVYEYVAERSIKPYSLVSRCRAVQVYEKRFSNAGEPYLAVHARVRDGRMQDVTLRKLSTELFAQMETYVENESFDNYMKETVGRWFGLKEGDLSGALNPNKEKVLFPVFKHADDLFRTPEFYEELLSLEATTGTVIRSLRESSNWDEFVWSVTCEETVPTQLDLDILSRKPSTLFPLATMNLGMSLSEALKPTSELYSASAIVSALTATEKDLIRFMLRYLPKSERSSAAKASLQMAQIRQEFKTTTTTVKASPGYGTVGVHGIEFYPSNPARTYDALPFNRIPDELRLKLAQRLLGEIHKVNEALENEEIKVGISYSSLVMSRNVQEQKKRLGEAFSVWFYEYVLEPSLRSQATIADINERFAKLFHAPAGACSDGLLLISTGPDKPVFCLSSIERQEDDLFETLASFVKHPPLNRGNSFVVQQAQTSGLAPLLMISPSRGVYSLDDVLEVIEGSAARIDAMLRKMGREVTPENRRAFLLFGPKECNSNNTWKYYAWGVTDLKTLVTLKMSNITEEEDWKAFAALPDEIFQELIELHSASPNAIFVSQMAQTKFRRLLFGLRDYKSLTTQTAFIPTEIRSKMKTRLNK